MRTLHGRVVVITGAGSGIGRALALAAASQGARVAISDIQQEGLAETAAEVTRLGADCRADSLDVADRAAVHEYADTVAEQFGSAQLVINNAGVALTGDLLDLTYADLDWILGINFWGVVHGTRAFLPQLIESGDGHLVNMSSLFGLIAVPGQSAYNATKFAVRGFTESVREEMRVAGHPVGVTTVHPGGIRTGIARSGRYSPSLDAAKLASHFDERLARTSPERAAEVILRGVLRDRPRVLIGADAHLLHHLAQLIGGRYQDLLATVSARIAP